MLGFCRGVACSATLAKRRTVQDRPIPAIAMRLAATLLLSAMFALAKLVQARGVGLVEALFFRQSIMLLPVLALAAAGPGLASLKTARPWAHAKRSAAGLTGMSLNFATVALLPLAETQTLWFTVPLIMTIFGALWLGERVGPHRWGAVAVGFLGVLIVFQPGTTSVAPLGLAMGLSSAVMMSMTAILVRQLGATEGSLTTVFWFGLLSSAALLVPMLFVVGPHDSTTWVLLLALGIVGGLGQVAMTFSLRFAPVSVLAPVDYAALIWAAGFGYLLFDAVPTPWTWVGAPVIVVSGLYIVWRERRLAKAASIGVID